MENKKLVWHLSNGDYIEGDKAHVFLNKKMNKYGKLISNIDSKLVECLKLNVKEYDGDIDYCVMETGERLSLIEILLEELLSDIKSVFDEDDLFKSLTKKRRKIF